MAKIKKRYTIDVTYGSEDQLKYHENKITSVIKMMKFVMNGSEGLSRYRCMRHRHNSFTVDVEDLTGKKY